MGTGHCLMVILLFLIEHSWKEFINISSSCFPELKNISSRKIIELSFLLLLIMYVYSPVIILEVNMYSLVIE